MITWVFQDKRWLPGLVVRIWHFRWHDLSSIPDHGTEIPQVTKLKIKKDKRDYTGSVELCQRHLGAAGRTREKEISKGR